MIAESASGLSKARMCLKKWVWGYMDNVWPPHTAENTTGTELHTANEHWLMRGDPGEMRPLIRELFALGLKHLPRPMAPGLMIEQKWKVAIDGREYTVVPDLEWYQGGLIRLYDYKSTKWAPRFSFKKREKYLDDVQFLLYARALFEKYPAATHLEGKWIYYKTPDEREGPDLEYEPKVYAWPHTFTRDEIVDAFRRVVAPVTEQVVQIRAKGLRAADVTGNMDTCDKMGGCHYATLGCDPMIGDENMNDIESLFGEFTKPAPAPKAEVKKPDVINAPEKLVAQADKTPEAAIEAYAPVAPPSDGDEQLAYDLFNLCRRHAVGEVVAALRPIARKLLG